MAWADVALASPVLLTQPIPQVHHINANYFLDITSMKPEDMENNVFSFSSTFEDPSTATYMQFLREGLRRGLPLLEP
ncbi:Selenoprotein N [Lemmus lemmus]